MDAGRGSECRGSGRWAMIGTTRREFLKVGGVAAAGLAFAPGWAASALGAAGRDRAPVLRFAHLTDLHLQPERAGVQGVAACLRHVQSLPDKVDLIVTGGDLIMDGYDATFDRTKLQWDLLMKVFKDECSLPVEHCLGNHDIFGWNKKKSRTTGDEKQWGKRWALEMLGLDKPFRSFTKAGWRFVILDSVQPEGESGYTGRLDDAQRAWLEADLAAHPAAPTLVVSHIPILSMCAVLGDGDKTDRAWNTGYSNMHGDGAALHKMFAQRGNVRLCVSGHIHLNDRVEVAQPGAPAGGRGVTYICDGAVSGAWWKGRQDRCDEGYGVFEVFDDGSFTHRYQTYGWKAKT